jgi:hypothetical protein
MSQAVCVGGDSPLETMVGWHQESGTNTRRQSEVFSSMLTRTLDTLECEGHTACFKFTIDGGECSCRFKPWWPDVWFVTVCKRLLMLQCHNCNHCQSWDWATGGA